MTNGHFPFLRKEQPAGAKLGCLIFVLKNIQAGSLETGT